MQTINEARLESDLAYRFGYLTEFMGFGPEDIDAIHGAARSWLLWYRPWSMRST